MNAFRCLRIAARPSHHPTFLRASLTPISAAQKRSISLLTPRRPILPTTTITSTSTSTTSTLLPCPGPHPSRHQPPSACTLDLVGKISAHPGLAGQQIRCGPRDTYNPSHLVRKRRHGFLSRLRTKKGRKMLMRRLKKGRWNLSH